jgi:serine/tyrosine/threonine adenylyltransferase
VDDADLDKLINPLLELMQRHELDFHSTFRKLSSFAPFKLSSDSEALATFLHELTPETQACKVPSARQAAIDDWKKWLEVYKARIESEADTWASEGDTWVEKRREEMRGANPRFVLRQWVLEEVIKKVEVDWKTGQRVLAKVLEVRV